MVMKSIENVSEALQKNFYQVAQNRVKVATDGNICEDRTFFEMLQKNFLLTS